MNAMNGQLLFHPSVPGDSVDRLTAALADLGVRPSVQRLPTRRGLGDAAWVVLLTVPVQAFLAALAEQAAKDAYDRLRAALRRAGRVVVRDTGSDLRIRLDPAIGEEAFRRLHELDPTGYDRGTLLAYDPGSAAWVPVGAVPAAGPGESASQGSVVPG